MPSITPMQASMPSLGAGRLAFRNAMPVPASAVPVRVATASVQAGKQGSRRTAVLSQTARGLSSTVSIGGCRDGAFSRAISSSRTAHRSGLPLEVRSVMSASDRSTGSDGSNQLLTFYEKKYQIDRNVEVPGHIRAKVYMSPSGRRIRVVVSTTIVSEGLYLHWAFTPQGKQDWVWEPPSRESWPPSSKMYREEAIHTEFMTDPKTGEPSVIFDFDAVTAPYSLNFVVKDAGGKWWDRHGGGFKIPLPLPEEEEEEELEDDEVGGAAAAAAAAAADDDAEVGSFLKGISKILGGTAAPAPKKKEPKRPAKMVAAAEAQYESDDTMKEVESMRINDEVFVDVTTNHNIIVRVRTDGGDEVNGEVWTDLPGDSLLLHWGVVPRGEPADSWILPSEAVWPRGTRNHKDRALQSPLDEVDDPNHRGSAIGLQLGPELPAAFRFVIKDERSDMWFYDNGGDFLVPLPTFEDADADAKFGPLGQAVLDEAYEDLSREAKRVSRDLEGSNNASMVTKKAVAEAEARADIARQAAAAAGKIADEAKQAVADGIPTSKVPGFPPKRNPNLDVVAVKARRLATQARTSAKRAIIAAEVAEVAARAAEAAQKEAEEAERRAKEEQEQWVLDLRKKEEDAAAEAQKALDEAQLAEAALEILEAEKKAAAVAAAADAAAAEIEEKLSRTKDAIGAAAESAANRGVEVQVEEVEKEVEKARQARKQAEERLREAKEAAVKVNPAASAPSQAETPEQQSERALHDASLEREREVLRREEAREVSVNPGTGTGREILCQFFNWESCKEPWFKRVGDQAHEVADMGFTVVWLPPPTDSVSPEGYMPRDLYSLNSNYGTKDELKGCVDALHGAGLKVLGDAVLNHRCAHAEKNGVWNQFGGKLAWDERAIVSDDPHFRGRGNPSSGDSFHAAPNIDHSQDFVRHDICEWLCWLKDEIGYDGWRLDFVRGFWGGYVKEYLEASDPEFCVGEYWDSLAYNYGSMDYNQDTHRQRIIDWMNDAGGLSGAFDVTTKGILHDVVGDNEYWRLKDESGNPPGVMGWWPSRAVTFIENHDTGSTQAHWPFPSDCVLQGYCYILTHPGTPTVFYDHIFHWHGLKEPIKKMIAIRKGTGIHCRSQVSILRADNECYAAQIDSRVVMKIGPGHFEPDSSKWTKALEGDRFAIWEARK